MNKLNFFFKMFTSILYPKNDANDFFNYYHSIRDSVFLNTSVEKEPAFLEWIGNICLTPVRYLFAGKDIFQVDPKEGIIESRQSFSYKEESWFLTAMMVLLLPIALILGSIFKGFAYLSEEVREKADAIEAHFQSEEVHIAYEEKFLSHEIARTLGLERKGEISKAQEAALLGLSKVLELFDDEGLVYWLDQKSAQGAYQYDHFLSGDPSIDLAIFTNDHQNVKNLLHRLDKSQYRVQDWSSYERPKTLLRLYLVEANAYITFHHYTKDQGQLTYDFSFRESSLPHEVKKEEEVSIPEELLFPLKKGSFGGVSVRVPHDIKGYLEARECGL